MSIRIKGDRPIKTPTGLSTRPTPSKVRAAVFNILQSQIKNANWLDICAGSGAMGAEALARGANQVIGIGLLIKIGKNLLSPNRNFKSLKAMQSKFYRNCHLNFLI